jgi:CRISPR/Cas system CSM-associated protein Csm3 (group 7 of RAMP superfamily)
VCALGTEKDILKKDTYAGGRGKRTFGKMTSQAQKMFTKENTYLKDKHLAEPFLCLKGCSNFHVKMTQIQKMDQP